MNFFVKNPATLAVWKLKNEAMTTDSSTMIPEQHTGSKSDNSYCIDAENADAARKLFDKAKDRLLNVNHWDDLSGAMTATFTLTDNKGVKLEGNAEEGDFFKIDIPGLGSREGSGYDWVQVEIIKDETNHEAESESFLMSVRPTANPCTPGDQTAHFFAPDASSNFLVERNGTIVTASVRGRNEKPNTDVSALDAIRNTVTAAAAILGTADNQWKRLVKGLLDE